MIGTNGHQDSFRRERIVIVTARGGESFSPDQVVRLARAGDVAFHRRTERIPPEQLIDLVGSAAVLAITPRSVPVLDADLIAELPSSLRGVAVFATGVDFVDLDALVERRVALSNLPDYSAISVAEHTIALLLTLARRVHLSRDRVLGRVPPMTSLRGWEVHGKTIAVVGNGRIGARVCALARALGMHVLAVDRRDATPTLAEALRLAEVVSLHVPTTFGGGPLIGVDEVELMHPGALLLNTSRARLVDEEAVVEALLCGRLGAYAVDDRLKNRERAARLIAEGRIVETGHTAWYSQEAIDRGTYEWVENIVALAEGRARNLVGNVPESLANV
jgi:phosphoglycerate dehydrogenase-like enzyme